MTLAEYFGPPSEPCLSCGCPYSWITGNVQVMQLCCRCYPRRGTPPDVWVELKRLYEKTQSEPVSNHEFRESSNSGISNLSTGSLWESGEA